MSQAVLVGDIGGTSSRLAIAERLSDGHIVLSAFRHYSNDDFSEFSDVLGEYLSDLEAEAPPREALFAMAGPPAPEGSLKLVNRDWPTVNRQTLERLHHLDRALLVNDFAAMARSVPELPVSDFLRLLPGVPQDEAPVLVTGPGTGFGIGTLIRLRSGAFHVVTGEGGHAGYVARTPLEVEIAARMRDIYGYVCTEMIVSGGWLDCVCDIVCDIHGRPRESVSPEDILARAAADEAFCVDLCHVRANGILEAAGNAALVNGTKGGVVLTGAVAKGLTAWLGAPQAVARFRERGSHSDYMEKIPVSILTSAQAPLIGAAALYFEEELAR
ncbi:MAG: hypothetical protein GYB42_12835 [Alphaproteobacteria bacterium]|nr:hypothetical protein [Alphaproteobacteria bacterium]